MAVVSRKGSWFVAFWAFFYLGAHLLQTLYPEWRIPEGLGRVVVGVLGVFFGTSERKKKGQT